FCSLKIHYKTSSFAGQPFDPSISVINAVCNVICALSFGHQFAPEDENFQNLIQALESIVKLTGNFFYLMYNVFPRLMGYLPGPHKKALASVDLIVSFAKQEIEKHKEFHALHEPQDFIDYYLLQMEKSKNDPNSTYNEDNLAIYICDFLGAGTDTTFATLKWALLLLANHPDIQDFLDDLLINWRTDYDPLHACFVSSTGVRACVGQQLARIEIFIFLTSLLRAFSFQLPEGVKELNEAPIVKVTWHPHPYKLCAIPTKA
ncbi:hypothetical protein Chor_014508, partial [Crotalus horridus]